MMRKRIVDAFILIAYMGVLGSLSESVGKSMPNEIKCENRHNMTITDIYVKSSVIKNDADVVSVSESDLENEEFCDSLEILATCVEAEAGNQDLYGKRLVVDVILNRVDSPRFPDNIEDVISQKYQFTTYWDGSMDRVTEPSDETFEAVRMELNGQRLDEDILFFTANEYNTYCVPAYRHRDHYFGY